MGTILVTGGAGFIGSHLTAALVERGHTVVVLDNLSSGKRKNLPKGVRLIKGDVSNPRVLRKLPKSVDAVFHLAAQIDVRVSVEDALDDARQNILGMINVLNYARDAKAKQVIFSSSGGAIYGPSEQIPTPETADCLPSSPYGLAKWSAEQYLDLYRRLHGLSATVLRYSNVYGPGQDGSKESGVIAIFTKRALEGKPLTIYGDGEQTRDFVYVKDVVAANLAAMDKGENQVVNIGTGTETSVNQLATLLQSELGQNLEVNKAEARAGEERRSCLAIEQAKNKIDWQPTYDLATGLKETIDALRA
jgi:UDP-glucose 4-epimerase